MRFHSDQPDDNETDISDKFLERLSIRNKANYTEKAQIS